MGRDIPKAFGVPPSLEEKFATSAVPPPVQTEEDAMERVCEMALQWGSRLGLVSEEDAMERVLLRASPWKRSFGEDRVGRGLGLQ